MRRKPATKNYFAMWLPDSVLTNAVRKSTLSGQRLGQGWIEVVIRSLISPDPTRKERGPRRFGWPRSVRRKAPQGAPSIRTGFLKRKIWRAMHSLRVVESLLLPRRALVRLRYVVDDLSQEAEPADHKIR